MVQFANLGAVVVLSLLLGARTQAAPSPTVALEWTRLLSQILCNHGVLFHDAAYYYSGLHLAQWQSLLALNTAGHDTTSQEAVVAFASHYVLANYFRFEQDLQLEVTLKGQLDRWGLTTEKQNAARIIALSVAYQLVQNRQGNGALYSLDSYRVPDKGLLGEYSFGPQDKLFSFPLPYSVFGQQPYQRPYILPAPETFRTDYLLPRYQPPTIPSPLWNEQWSISFSKGRDNSTSRTPDQTASAFFWGGASKGAVCSQPWLDVTVESIPSTWGLFDAVQLLAKMSVALHDGNILGFHLQYTYRHWRPASAIRQGDPVHPPVPDWTPLGLTPAHPEYPSITATACGVATTLLQYYLPNDTDITVVGHLAAGSAPEVQPRSFQSWEAAARDCAMSRVYLGVHFKISVDHGLAVGKKVADYVRRNWATVTPAGVLPNPMFLEFFGDRLKATGTASPPGYVLPASQDTFNDPLPHV